MVRSWFNGWEGGGLKGIGGSGRGVRISFRDSISAPSEKNLLRIIHQQFPCQLLSALQQATPILDRRHFRLLCKEDRLLLFPSFNLHARILLSTPSPSDLFAELPISFPLSNRESCSCTR